MMTGLTACRTGTEVKVSLSRRAFPAFKKKTITLDKRDRFVVDLY